MGSAVPDEGNSIVKSQRQGYVLDHRYGGSRGERRGWRGPQRLVLCLCLCLGLRRCLHLPISVNRVAWGGGDGHEKFFESLKVIE